MKIEKIKKLLKSEHYNFLRANEHLGSNIILLGLGSGYVGGMTELFKNFGLDIDEGRD